MAWVTIGSTSEVAEGSMKGFTAGGRRILVARLQGKFYALDGRCPHMSADLSRGRLEGSVLICPLHGSRFDVRDGHVLAWIDRLPGLIKAAAKTLKKPTPARTYPISVRDGMLSVDIPE